MLNLLVRFFYWLCRFRHRCGYGIHSPFAFSFVRGVIYERGRYYAYDRLTEVYRSTECPEMRLKDYFLCFRLANASRADRVYCAPTLAAPLSAFLHSARHSSMYVANPLEAELRFFDGRYSLPADWGDGLQPGGIAIVCFYNKVRRENFAFPEGDITFDLRTFLIVVCRPDLYQEHYIINYF